MAKYKIEVDRELCIGDGACCDEAPQVFELDDESIAIILSADGNTPEEILAAAQSCPVDAIILRDAETDEQVWPEE